MTSNDAQIDVLLRRSAGRSPSQPANEHLDADELNAFAEGSLPAAARVRYVSHLVDCDHCRQIVSQLAISGGALVQTESETSADTRGYSWWKRFSGFFSPLTMRYTAFAAVLVLIVGIGFFVIRQRPAPTLVAQNDQSKPAAPSALKPSGDAPPQAGSASQSAAVENKQALPSSASQTSPSLDEVAKLDKPDNPTVPPKPAKEAEAPANPLPAPSKKGETGVTQVVPSYAPPPPVEGQRAETLAREQESPKGLASASGPRKSAPPADNLKLMDRARTGESEKDIRAGDDSSRAGVSQPSTSKRAGVEKAKGPRRDAENNARNRNSNEVQNDAAKTQGLTTNRAAAEEKPPETRSAGGRKFRRQGSAWVDVKFKSSMTLKSVSRGSSDFNDLDSGLRSIAQQLGGEVIVVWIGKAYLIR